MFLLGFACAVVSLILLSRLVLVFGRLVVAVVSCACVDVPARHTSTALFKFTLF